MNFNLFVKRKDDEPRVKVITHDDTDGCICSLVAKKTFSNIEVEYCSNNKVNDIITSFILDKRYKEFDLILITDLALNAGVVNLINKIIEIEKDNIKIQYIDHHKSALWLNDYPWADVVDKSGDVPTCAAELLYKYFVLNYHLKQSKWLSDVVEKARRFDTWEWKTKYNDIEAKRMNTLCFAYGCKAFTEGMIKKSEKEDPIFSDLDMNIIENEEQKYKERLLEKIDDILLSKITVDGTEYKLGIVYAEDYISELGNDIAEKYNNLDFIMINNSFKKVSFRALNNKNIDLTKIAALFGGGGHPKASGASIDLKTREECLVYFLERYKENNEK